MKRGLFLLVAAGALVVSHSAFGQASDNVIEEVQTSIIGQARSWETALLQHATNLFWLLAGI